MREIVFLRVWQSIKTTLGLSAAVQEGSLGSGNVCNRGLRIAPGNLWFAEISTFFFFLITITFSICCGLGALEVRLSQPGKINSFPLSIRPRSVATARTNALQLHHLPYLLFKLAKHFRSPSFRSSCISQKMAGMSPTSNGSSVPFLAVMITSLPRPRAKPTS